MTLSSVIGSRSGTGKPAQTEFAEYLRSYFVLLIRCEKSASQRNYARLSVAYSAVGRSLAQQVVQNWIPRRTQLSLVGR